MIQSDWGKLLRTVEDDVLISQSLAGAIDSGKIVPSLLPAEVEITDIPGGKTIRASRDRQIVAEDLQTWVRNVQLALLGMWMLMTDQALEAQHGTDRLRDTNHERQAVRCMIYQMRCAVAHTSYAAAWQVSSGFRRPFTVSGMKSGPLTLDFGQLNGQPFRPSQFGGWYRVIELLQYGRQFL